MNSRIKVDRLSVLPDNVKDSILTRLTIKEAVRTSILSQSWRYQWHSLSKINIDRSDLLEVSQVEERVKIIDRILFLHCGSLDKFKVYIDFDTPTTDVDSWIIYLSRHGIKDLILESSVCMFGFLRLMPLLQRLELKHHALQELAAGETPISLPFVCPVKHLILWIDFKDLKEMEAAFCIFRSSPFIQILELTFFRQGPAGIYANAFWKGEEGLNLRFENLEEVKLTSFTGTKYELKFIEFLLAHAPALETMEIKFSHECKNVEGLFTMFTKLACFPRASPKAKLILPSNMSLTLPSN